MTESNEVKHALARMEQAVHDVLAMRSRAEQIAILRDLELNVAVRLERLER
jgi:hypothetical protein